MTDCCNPSCELCGDEPLTAPGNPAKFSPTPDEIRRGCEAIRSEWSAAETMKRAAWSGSAARIPTSRLGEYD